jgi:stringent starvation protein B
MYEWCTDNGYTPYIAAYVDETVQVPREHVKNNEIVLNISMDATSSLKLGNEFVEFKARFSGSAREIMVPIARVIAIYARENGQGMAFPAPQGQDTATRGETTSPEAKMQVAVKKSGDKVGATVGEAHSSAGANQANSKVVQLVAVAPSAAQDDDETPPPVPPSQNSSGVRPALTRIK